MNLRRKVAFHAVVINPARKTGNGATEARAGGVCGMTARQRAERKQELMMQKRTVMYSLALLAVVGGSLGSAALADQMRMGGGMMGQRPDFATLDADKDGKVTAQEFAAARNARIAGLDADKDGKISLDELVAMQMRGAEAQARARAEQMIAMMDADGDGALAAAELLDMPGPGMAMMIERMDTDGDGALSAAEFDARGPGRDGGQMGGKGHGRGHGDHGQGDHGHGMKGQGQMGGHMAQPGCGMGQGAGQGMTPAGDCPMGGNGPGNGPGNGMGMGNGMGQQGSGN